MSAETRDITYRFTYVRHAGVTYVQMQGLLALLDDAGTTEPLAAQLARELRDSERRATRDTPHLVELVAPRARSWWRRP